MATVKQRIFDFMAASNGKPVTFAKIRDGLQIDGKKVSANLCQMRNEGMLKHHSVGHWVLDRRVKRPVTVAEKIALRVAEDKARQRQERAEAVKESIFSSPYNALIVARVVTL